MIWHFMESGGPAGANKASSTRLRLFYADYRSERSCLYRVANP